jgi:hypothetical protein
MSGTTDPGLLGLDACGCGSGTRIEVPAEVANRPGLPAIAYRAGTHGGFLRSALARLSAAERPQLSRLATREEDDLTIALLDAWAAAGDVLGFYQERIANECYLRTATERLSVRELARLIGYELRPGVAASTLLAFMAEAAPGAFGAALAPRTALPTLPGGGSGGAGGPHPRGRARAQRARARRDLRDLRDRRGDRGPGGVERDPRPADAAAPDPGRCGDAAVRRPGDGPEARGWPHPRAR